MKIMLVRLIIILFLVNYSPKLLAQINLHTEDLPRFYQAFDSVVTTKDTLKQIEYINRLYIEPSSKGLKEFMEIRWGTASKWRRLMEKEREGLIQKRVSILSVLSQEKLINEKINVFKRLYPDFRDGDIYFCVGINNSGGTVNDRTVYIGTEVAASDKKNWAVPLVLHEFTHTQQWIQRNIQEILASDSLVNAYEKSHTQLLGKCIEEGMADFVSELVYGESLAKINSLGYTAFGLKNEKDIKKLFAKEMFMKFEDTKGWLYSGKIINGSKVNDLGYFIGYRICSNFYRMAKDKKLALKKMIELNLTDENAKEFLIDSEYFSEKEILLNLPSR